MRDEVVKVKVNQACRVTFPAKGKDKERTYEPGEEFSCDVKVAAGLIQGGTVIAVGEGGITDVDA